MRVLKLVLMNAVLGVAAMAAAQAAVITTPTVPSLELTRKCPVVVGDNPDDPKVVPNLVAGRGEAEAGHFARAAAHFRALAEDGNVEAERELGALLLRDGCPVQTDKAAGLSWLRKAADKDDARAQYLYSDALLHGNGTAEDDKGAFLWAKRAAKADWAPAQTSLGYLYFAGRGVKINPHEGIVWSVKAGEQGSAEALSNIAKSYLTGKGVPKDLHQAMFMMALAMQRIPPLQYQITTRYNVTRYNIASKLSVEEVRTIEKDAEKWAPTKGSLAKVLADAEKWSPDDDRPAGTSGE
ncbi:MAG: tetratricopeptide repeat protein [Rhizomicrobium sp.]|nr:tetratricopeptide repeat protein [Rhizomicrobium sp.]